MDDKLREAIREAVHEVLQEEHSHPQFHRRAPLARQKDPNGREWYSATISKVQAISAILALLVAIFSGVWASMAVRDDIVVMPRVETVVDERIAEHEDHVREAMEAVRPTIATKSEVDQLAKDLAVSRAERIEQYTAIQAQLNRIEARLDRLGR